MNPGGSIPLSAPGGIESLRGRSDPEAIRAVAREMESLFAYEMLKAMRATTGGMGGGNGFGGDVYGTLFDLEIARVLADRGLGLREVLLRGLGREPSPPAVVESPVRAAEETAALPIAPAAPPSVSDAEPPGKQAEGAPAPPSPRESASPLRGGGRLSSGFGFRKDPFTGGVAFHHGIDLAAPEGTPVYPVKEGKVVFSGSAKGYGNLVVVDHGDGFVTKYAHNRANRVAAGDRVNSETVIAEVGRTGRSTGPHLHFELLHEGKRVHPTGIYAGKTKGNG